MEIHSYLATIHLLEKLKITPRHCYTEDDRRESVAEHSWRLSLMAYFLKDEYPDADIQKVILMCLIHDLGEIFTGDIPTFLKTTADDQHESDLLNAWVNTLPPAYSNELSNLYQEMELQQTLESKIYKVLDKIEAVIAHNESDIGTWLPNEYELQLNHGVEQSKFSSYMTQFRDLVKEESQQMIDLAKSKA